MKYPRVTVRRIGRRKRNRKTWKGRYNPEDCVGKGKNGAMPEPGCVSACVIWYLLAI